MEVFTHPMYSQLRSYWCYKPGGHLDHGTIWSGWSTVKPGLNAATLYSHLLWSSNQTLSSTKQPGKTRRGGGVRLGYFVKCVARVLSCACECACASFLFQAIGYQPFKNCIRICGIIESISIIVLIPSQSVSFILHTQYVHNIKARFTLSLKQPWLRIVNTMTSWQFEAVQLACSRSVNMHLSRAHRNYQ